MAYIENPFVVSRYVSDEYFCDRKQETETLIKHIRNGRNVFFTAPRRMGKTGLICHFFEQQEIKDHYNTIFVDLYGTNSLKELVYLFGKAVMDSLRSKSERMVERMLEFLKAVHLGVSFDPVTGNTGMDFGIGAITEEQSTLQDIFRFLEQADKPCIVAFDEFQQVAEYDEKNVEALLRTHIQHCSNTSFIYAGSKRHSIAQMFNSPAKPFYASSTAMILDPIDMDVYNAFAMEKFEAYGKRLAPDALPVVYTRYDGCTWYVQSIMNELFALTPVGGACNSEMVETASENILAAQHSNYQLLMTFLASKQKQVLQAIAREGTAKQIGSSEFLKKHHLPSASSVQAALKGLMDKDFVTRLDDGSYRVYDYFFGEWLARR